MTYDPDHHAFFRECIAVALAGGLTADEQAAFDAHRAACAACAAEFEHARESEARMTALFAAALPAAGFEDRVIQRLRREPRPSRWVFRLPHPQRVHPAMTHAATGVAAALVLAATGVVVSGFLEPMRMERRRSASSLGNETQALAATSGETRSSRTEGENVKTLGGNRTWDFYAAAPATPPQQGSASSGSERWGRAEEGMGLRVGQSATAGDSAGRAGGREAQKQDESSAAPNASSEGKRGEHAITFQDGSVNGNLNFSGVASQAGAQAGRPLDHAWFKPTQLVLQDQSKEETTFSYDAGDTVIAPRDSEQGSPVQSGKPTAPTPTKAPASGGGGGAGGSGGAAKGVEQIVAGVVVQTAAAPVTQAETTTRRVIRNGSLEFEVDRFDSAFAQVSKLTSEAGGYVSTTSSQKLPNGKVQGTVTARVPPDRLDTLVLQLRGIGDLKSQSLEAEDVSKKYTDLESQLRAARAMEERLIAIIKEGKGQIKDLLAAEKELGVWRTKVEQLVGEMKYYDNLVAMATLNLTLTERDIATPATAYEAENIDAGIESEDVEKARAAALKAIEEAKGRVVQSELKRYDAGQFGATIVAEVPPDTAGPLLDRLKQVGKLSRLDVQRKQTAGGKGSDAASAGAARAPVRVEKRDTRFNLSIYNLANVAPRQSVSLSLAADDVEATYQKVLDRVAKAGGRIVTSNLNRQRPEQTTGTISFEVPAAAADALTNDLRASGEPIKLTVTENPDLQNVTTAKRGFGVSLASTASVAPREIASVEIAVTDVVQAREKILQAASGAAARVIASQLNESDRQNVSATLELDVKRDALPAVEKVLADAGQIIKRQVQRTSNTDNTLDTKVRFALALTPAEKLPPRETTTLAVEHADVEPAMAAIQAAAIEAGGRVAQSNLTKDRDGRGVARVSVDVPLEKSAQIVSQARELGVVRGIDASKDLQVPPGPLARARIDVTFASADTLVDPERGLFASIRRGLATSLAGLMWSVQLIIIGLCFVLPWALVLYAAWRVLKRRGKVEAAPAAA